MAKRRGNIAKEVAETAVNSKRKASSPASSAGRINKKEKHSKNEERTAHCPGGKQSNKNEKQRKNEENTAPSPGGSRATDPVELEKHAGFLAWLARLNGPAYGEPGYSLWFSPNPHKRAIEKAWLEWTAIWCSVMGYIMVTGLGSYWEDSGLMFLGTTLMMGTYYWPHFRASHLHYPTLNAMFYGNCALSFCMHYVATPFFFDVLHMRYGFKVELRIDRNPVFLYFLTVAYFATYSVLASCCVRRAQHFCYYGKFWREGANSLLKLVVGFLRGCLICAVPFLVALLETITNANPFIAELFCYDSTVFALTFGSFAYGLGFVFSTPVWLYGVSDEPLCLTMEEMTTPENKFDPLFSKKSCLWHAVLGQVAAVILHGMCLYFLRHYVAPNYTSVIPDSSPFGGCLADTQRPMNEWLELLSRVGLDL